MSKRLCDKLRQRLEALFGKEGLEITVETRKGQADFLDVTLRLENEDYKPYKKPNHTPLYVHTQSNHPPQVIKQIPMV